ncbi:hypothetical protein PR048_026409 [Dryococelus australis]|uniref:Uncharacterized protein n=1 Tax=Dryococelus australis TaxID=614101 RepID=A0ABQ9GL88_9NEOP|nr:hypothetical protein PR048_026409 [Dryococelus australis]
MAGAYGSFTSVSCFSNSSELILTYGADTMCRCGGIIDDDAVEVRSHWSSQCAAGQSPNQTSCDDHDVVHLSPPGGQITMMLALTCGEGYTDKELSSYIVLTCAVEITNSPSDAISGERLSETVISNVQAALSIHKQPCSYWPRQEVRHPRAALPRAVWTCFVLAHCHTRGSIGLSCQLSILCRAKRRLSLAASRTLDVCLHNCALRGMPVVKMCAHQRFAYESFQFMVEKDDPGDTQETIQIQDTQQLIHLTRLPGLPMAREAAAMICYMPEAVAFEASTQRQSRKAACPVDRTPHARSNAPPVTNRTHLRTNIKGTLHTFCPPLTCPHATERGGWCQTKDKAHSLSQPRLLGLPSTRHPPAAEQIILSMAGSSGDELGPQEVALSCSSTRTGPPATAGKMAPVASIAPSLYTPFLTSHRIPRNLFDITTAQLAEVALPCLLWQPRNPCRGQPQQHYCSLKIMSNEIRDEVVQRGCHHRNLLPRKEERSMRDTSGPSGWRRWPSGAVGAEELGPSGRLWFSEAAKDTADLWWTSMTEKGEGEASLSSQGVGNSILEGVIFLSPGMEVLIYLISLVGSCGSCAAPVECMLPSSGTLWNWHELPGRCQWFMPECKGRRNGRFPEKHLLTSCIIQHDSHLRKSRSGSSGYRTQITWVEGNLCMHEDYLPSIHPCSPFSKATASIPPSPPNPPPHLSISDHHKYVKLVCYKLTEPSKTPTCSEQGNAARFPEHMKEDTVPLSPLFYGIGSASCPSPLYVCSQCADPSLSLVVVVATAFCSAAITHHFAASTYLAFMTAQGSTLQAVYLESQRGFNRPSGLIQKGLRISSLAERGEGNDQNILESIANEKAGDGRHSGTMMWPGSDYEYQNTRPTFQMNFSVSVPWEQRVDTVIDWFLDPVTPANLAMLYIEEPDASAHIFGPESSQVLKQVLVRLFASHQGEPGSIPSEVAPGFSHVGIVPDDIPGQQVFLGISHFPPPLHSGTASYSPCFTIIGS